MSYSILSISRWLSFNHGANLRLFRRIANRLFSLTYKRQNPGFVSGADCLIAYAYSYLPFEQRKCGWVPRELVYSVPPFISFIAKHTGAGFPFTGNSGLKYRHVPHIFSGRRLSGAHSVGIFGIISGQLFFAFMLLRFDSYPLTRILSGRRLCVAILLIFHPK